MKNDQVNLHTHINTYILSYIHYIHIHIHPRNIHYREFNPSLHFIVSVNTA